MAVAGARQWVTVEGAHSLTPPATAVPRNPLAQGQSNVNTAL